LNDPGRSNTASARKSLLKARVLRWYRKNGRSLPWRNERDPYCILVSEVMLQQTQVSRVLTKYPQFLGRFPSLKSLAMSRTSDVIKAWEGMGYNSRALRLRKLAAMVLKDNHGRIPGSIPELKRLPGIGRYTAHAIVCFAFVQRVPVVDTNIRRILARIFPPTRRKPLTEDDIWGLAESLLPRQHAHDWNQALMDLGATVCTAAQPKCNLCPIVDLCPSAHKVRRKEPSVRRAEPGRDGIPNRIYRGRTIQALRELGAGETMSRAALGQIIKPDFASADRRWFEAVLWGLEKDGLIRLRARKRISLPE
jgi:A/G-specific adenine glycosylase